MAGRPRTMHRNVQAVLDRVTAIEDRLIALIPDQYDDTTIDNSELPYNDLGRVWRESIDKIQGAVMQLEWLECLLGAKAKAAEQAAASDDPERVGAADDPHGWATAPTECSADGNQNGE